MPIEKVSENPGQMIAEDNDRYRTSSPMAKPKNKKHSLTAELLFGLTGGAAAQERNTILGRRSSS